MIYLTISTGIGGGVIMDEKLLLGANGLGAELGHVTIDPDGPICSCGQPGHIEALASGTALASRAITQLESGATSSLRAIWETSPLTARHIGQAAEEGDDLASRLVEETGKMIGRYLADLSHIFNPKTIVLGGGVTQIGELLFQPIRTAVKKYALSSEYYKELDIVPASLGDDAGLIGAMVLASMQ
jgi:glucokinase